jgi:hypothetical protein
MAYRKWIIGLTLLLSAAAPAEKASKPMSTIKVERLGSVSPFEKKDGWRKAEEIEPTPIVLWRGLDVAAALYYQWESDGVRGKLQQKIASVDTRAKTWLKSVDTNFPLKFSGHAIANRDESALPAFDVEHLQVADLDGDGTDELILPRYQGGVDVYHVSKGKIFSWKSPIWEEKYYSNRVTAVQKAKAGGRESVYFTFSAKHDGDLKIPPEVEKAHASHPLESIVEVTGAGVRVIPLQGLPGVVTQIVGVGLLNRPGSSQIDELAVCARVEGKSETFFSRHSLAGALIGKVREIYAEVASYQRIDFSFLPQSNELFGVEESSECVVFVWPEKPVNWFKLVKLSPGGGFRFLGVVERKSGNPKILFRRGHDLIAIDPDGRCHRREGERSVPGKEGETVPWMVLTPTSELHSVDQVVLLEGDDDAVLVIENRDHGVRKLSLAEAREAAHKYLDPNYVERVERQFAVTFEHVYDERRIPDNFLGPNAATPLRTLEDIKRLLPDYYAHSSASLQEGLQGDLTVELMEPLDPGGAIAETKYRNIPEYKAWLASLQYDSSVRIRVFAGRGTLADHTLAGTQLYATTIQVKRAGDRLNIVAPLNRPEPTVVVTGFFLLSLS